ncbi:invasion associated locus B family protein [Neomegalonema perideroedes]|uniref:hypothetical protein n=1 Tax=Neomegalonema perideroedes TaxID=217219 RepID=UPI00036C8634|nr:hypothetical protein [Neomegalonema perideroedes]
MRRLSAALFALASALTLSPAAQAQEAGPQSFGDWTGLCVSGHCSLSAFSDPQGPVAFRPQGPQPAYRLSLLRRAGSPWDEIVFTPVGGSVQPGSLIGLRIDAASIARLDAADGWNPVGDGAPNEILFAPSISQADLLPRMRQGRALIVDFTGDDGRARQARFSLNGLGAGEAWLAAPR